MLVQMMFMILSLLSILQTPQAWKRMPLNRRHSCNSFLHHASQQSHFTSESIPTVTSLNSDSKQKLMNIMNIFAVATNAALLVKTTEVMASSVAPSLGVDGTGLFEVCPDRTIFTSCVSSQDDRPAFFLAPWMYDGKMEDIKQRLIGTLLLMKGATITSTKEQIDKDGRYIRAEFLNTDKTIDDVEFYFTPNDATIQYRSLRRGNGLDVLGENRKRIENIRMSMRFENVPVLRNRKNVLFFVESPLDTFGPPTIVFDKLVDQVKDQAKDQQGVVGVLDPVKSLWEKTM